MAPAPEPIKPDTDPRWLTRGVAGIGTASLLADAGHEIPTALLPSLLSATLGAPAAALGLIEGVSDAMAGAARLASGALADDPTRRRRVAVGGYTSTVALAALTGAATTLWQVGVLRAAAWAARSPRAPARNALLADVVAPTAYGRAYGFERAMDNLGAILGPLLALGLVAALRVRTAIGLSIIPGLLAAAAILYAIRHTPAPHSRDRVPLRLQVRPILHGDLGRLMAAAAAFEAGNVAATLLILRATSLLTPAHGTRTATTLALALYTRYNLAAAAASLPTGRAADRLGARGPILVFAAGTALFLAAYLGFATTNTNLAVLTLPFLAAGTAIGCVETAQHSAVAALAPTGLRGSAFRLLATIQAAGNLTASAVAGLLWTVETPTIAFLHLSSWIPLAPTGTLTATRRAHPSSPTEGRR